MQVNGPLAPPPKGMSKRKWQQLCEAHEALREKLLSEYERPRAWRNDAPRAGDWKVGVLVPIKHHT